jgi:hypothetical protein
MPNDIFNMQMIISAKQLAIRHVERIVGSFFLYNTRLLDSPPPSAATLFMTFFALSALFVILIYNKKNNSHTPSFKSDTSLLILLCLIDGFDAVRGMPIDYMHGVLLGIVKMFFSFWFDNK